MSSRALKAKLAPQISLPNFSEESDKREPEDQNLEFTNPFDVLGSPVEETEIRHQEKSGFPVENYDQSQKLPTKKNKKRRKKKHAQHTAPCNNKAKNPHDEDDDIESLVKELGIVTSPDKNTGQTKIESSLLKIDPSMLDPTTEIRRLFGPGVINAVKEPKESRLQRRAVRHRKTRLVKPKELWPKFEFGLNMQLVETKYGTNYYKMVWSESYKELQKIFFECVNTGDPNTLVDLVLSKHPYHVDSLLQLAEAFIIMKDLENAADFIERIIYIFECSWHPYFNPFDAPIHRLEYRHPENRPFLIAFFRHIQDLGRRGCSRTALEFCKLLLGLDLHDPLFILLAIDHYALRCKEFDFLIELSYSNLFPEKDLNSLPNFVFSLALAKFFLETGTSSNKAKTNKPQTSETPNRKLLPSSELLQNALMLFPMVFVPLLKKMSIHSIDIKDSEGYVSDLMLHPFYVDTKCPPVLWSLITLFVERSYLLWKDPKVLSWLKESAIAVKNRVESKDPMVENCAVIRQELYGDMTLDESIVRHILLSDYPDSVATLPADAIRQGIRIYEELPQPHNQNQNAPRRIGNVPTNSLLGLFLQSLLPFDIGAIDRTTNDNDDHDSTSDTDNED
jgi:hypothetical protein